MSSTQPVLIDQGTRDQIHSRPCPKCCYCGTTGVPLYANLKDRLYGAPGTWNLSRCSEPECGLLWLDPMPVEDDIDKAYEDYFTHTEAELSQKNWLGRAKGLLKGGYLARKYGYGKELTGRWKQLSGTMIKLHPGLSAELDFSVMYLPCLQNGKLLDVGCGSGQALQRMAELGWQVQGVDFDPKAVQIAKKKGLEVRLGSLQSQSYASDCFDAITMSHVIEHVHDPLSLLNECRRILRPGGHLVVVTPNSRSWLHRRFGACWMHLDPPRHLHIFSERSLRGFAAKAGFHRVRLWTTIRHADGVFIGSRSIVRTGRHRMEQVVRHPFHWNRRIQLVEWALLKGAPGLGEEIALLAVKGPAVPC